MPFSHKKTLVLPAACTGKCADTVICTKVNQTHLPVDLTHELYKERERNPSMTKGEMKTFLTGLMRDERGVSRVSREPPYFPSEEYATAHGEKSEGDWESSCTKAIELCEYANIPDPIFKKGVMQKWVGSASFGREKQARAIYNKLVDCMNSGGSGGGGALSAVRKKKSKKKRRKTKKRIKSKKRKSRKRKSRRR